jgi:hypothetical protein
MRTIRFASEFDPHRIAWGKPNSPRSALCSYCFDTVSDGAIPMILCKPDGHVAQFCERCINRYVRNDAH